MKYLLPALLHRWRLPVFGDVPVNLLALAGFTVAGFDNPVMWGAGAAWESVWLLATAGRTGYRRKIDAALRRRAWQEAEKHRLTIYNRLTPDLQARHHALRTTVAPLTDRREGSATPRDAGVELLTLLHLRLLAARAALVTTAPAREVPGEADTLSRLQAGVLVDLTDPSTAAIATHAISLLETRRVQQEDTRARLAALDADLASIEESLRAALHRANLSTQPPPLPASLALGRDMLAHDEPGVPREPARD